MIATSIVIGPGTNDPYPGTGWGLAPPRFQSSRSSFSIPDMNNDGGADTAIWVGNSTAPDQKPDDKRGAEANTIGQGASSKALDQFLKKVEQRAYRSARYALWDDELALDVAQDAMLKLVEKYSTRPATQWPALFYTILNNRIRDVQRRRMVRDKAGKIVSLFRTRPGEAGEVDRLETELGDYDVARGAAPEHALRDKQIRAALDKAIATLSWRQRQVYLLRDLQGLNVKDTAQVLGCSEGSVKQHHFRAMQALRSFSAYNWGHSFR
ncbi:MAG TPA: RNA polymerase sigma factor [Acidiferrobacteraceae bacterium]|nr:RNA polymerase sigma factor [Acidiferrobacteraceae bacterium]